MILQPVFVRHVPRRNYVVFCRVARTAVTLAALIAVASIVALTQEVIVAFGSLAGFRLFFVAVIVMAVAAGGLALARTIELVHASGKRDGHAIYVTGLQVLLGWFALGLLVALPVAFAASTSHTRISGIAGHEALLISESSWDETSLSVYTGDGIFLHPVPVDLPLAAPGFHPIASGAYSLIDDNGTLVLNYATSPDGAISTNRVVID